MHDLMVSLKGTMHHFMESGQFWAVFGVAAVSAMIHAIQAPKTNHSHWPLTMLGGWVSLGVVVALLGGCGSGAAIITSPDAAADARCGTCEPDELCVDEGDAAVCAHICANGLHCWSACCTAEGDAGYNVCRPAAICFGAK